MHLLFYFIWVFLHTGSILLLSTSATFTFHCVVLLSLVIYAFLASRVVVVISGWGILGLVFFISIGGGIIDMSMAIRPGTYHSISIWSISWAVVVVYYEYIWLCAGDIYHYYCGSGLYIIGDFSLVLLCPLLSTPLYFPTGLLTTSSIS
jgi:hypothetical protein